MDALLLTRSPFPPALVHGDVLIHPARPLLCGGALAPESRS